VASLLLKKDKARGRGRGEKGGVREGKGGEGGKRERRDMHTSWHEGHV
jgi:hypothetical protein